MLELVTKIVALQHDRTIAWTVAKNLNPHPCLDFSHILGIVEANHAFNYQLWHAEDRARRDDMGFEFVYRAKREIDAYNQQRNNCMQAIDEYLYPQAAPVSAHCLAHSETPGMMIDRLSILALKAFYMSLQAERIDAPVAHRNACSTKLAVLEQQKNNLAKCANNFLAAIAAKTETFQVYHQFKMYNDPTLNPQLYGIKR